ncbi:uncharacterized protein [Rutidosis leptorrhynchoides]
MPSGAKKRKAAKKKQVHNPSTTNHNQGEKDVGELNSPTSQDPSIVVEKREDVSSDNKFKDANEIEIRSKSKSSSSSSSSDGSDDESNVADQTVVLESAPVESVPVVESLPETITPNVDPVKPVDSLLDEVSKVFDEIKNEEKKELVVDETPVVAEQTPVVVEEQTVVSEIVIKDDLPTSSVVVESVLNENEVEKLPVSVEKASLEFVDSSMLPKDSISQVNGADCANDADTIEHEQSDKQATVGSTPPLVQKTTSWKSCCGIFELFSGSQR